MAHVLSTEDVVTPDLSAGKLRTTPGGFYINGVPDGTAGRALLSATSVSQQLSSLGLYNVDNIRDSAKTVANANFATSAGSATTATSAANAVAGSALETALNSKANLSGATFTGQLWTSYGNTNMGGYSWTNAALTTNSIEIVNNNSVVTNSSPTLAFHRYGSGGPQFRLDPTGTNVLYLESSSASAARNPNAYGGGTNSYFSKLHIDGGLFSTGTMEVSGHSGILNINPDFAGAYDLPAGVNIASTLSSLSLYAAGNTGLSGNKIGMYYWNGEWKSGLELANTGSGGGVGKLLLMKGGGYVGIGTFASNSLLHVAGQGYFDGQIISHNNTASIANSTLGTAGLETRSAGNVAAAIIFHREGSWAAALGIDTDNQLRYGGWSLGGNNYAIFHEGLTTVRLAGTLYAPTRINFGGNSEAASFHTTGGNTLMLKSGGTDRTLMEIHSPDGYNGGIIQVLGSGYGLNYGGLLISPTPTSTDQRLYLGGSEIRAMGNLTASGASKAILFQAFRDSSDGGPYVTFKYNDLNGQWAFGMDVGVTPGDKYIGLKYYSGSGSWQTAAFYVTPAAPSTLVANTLTVNNGITAANASSTASTSVANVGTLDSRYSQATWITGDGSFEVNVGSGSSSLSYGAAVGGYSNAVQNGVAVGYQAEGIYGGVALGQNAKCYGYGIAIGYGTTTNAILQRIEIAACSAYGYNNNTGSDTGLYVGPRVSGQANGEIHLSYAKGWSPGPMSNNDLGNADGTIPNGMWTMKVADNETYAYGYFNVNGSIKWFAVPLY